MEEQIKNKDNSHPMDQLKSIMATLRGKNGCPWDLEQNHKSLIPCLLEESYEVVDAIELNDTDGLKEELGDLLFQSVFHARLAEENGQFNIEDVINGISEKLIRRHPHVFGDQSGVDSAEKVVTQWEDIKSKEKLSKSNGNNVFESVLDSIPRAFPAILTSEKIQSKVAELGFDWEEWQEPIDKLWEEVSELKVELEALKSWKDSNVSELNSNKKKIKELIPNDLKSKIENEMGDVLFSIINVARHLGIDPETSLRKTNNKFSTRFKYIEKTSIELGKSLKEMNLSEMDELWNQAKKLESKQV
jgi:MazG family protein